MKEAGLSLPNDREELKYFYGKYQLDIVLHGLFAQQIFGVHF